MRLLRSVSLLALVSGALSASAQVTSVGEFSGSRSEGFEGFPNYDDVPNSFVQEPVSIMGGFATLTSAHADLLVYETGTDATFGLGLGDADVHSGSKGIGFNSYADTGTIAFSSGVARFGGYFNATYNGPIAFTFFGQDGVQLGSTLVGVPPSGTSLGFIGFESTQAIYSVSITGDFLVADDLQASPFASPAVPGPMAALPFALMALKRRKRA